MMGTRDSGVVLLKLSMNLWKLISPRKMKT